MRVIVGLIFLVNFSFIGKAQNNYEFTRINEFYSFIDLDVSENNNLNIASENLKYTSLKIVIQKPFKNPIRIGYQNGDGLLNFLNANISDHADEGLVGNYSSELQIFNIPQTAININFGDFKGHVKLILLYAPIISNSNSDKLYKASNRCDKPQMISYTVWREFLPNPKPPRESTDVEHLVIHHSAGNNADTNYLGIVRNIYLLHTQTNGWDDIGYNFLVAPNGIIFNGRDPQGVDDDDNILGAHYCGKNQNTMGVCMLGDFMNVRPTTQALFSLKYLLAWKLKKDKIDAFGQTRHPRPNGNLLNNICGHKDGCNTDCPGDSLYALLPLIKAEAARIADSCGLILSFKILEPSKNITLFPNPGSGKITINSSPELLHQSIEIYGLAGNLVFKTSFITGESHESGLPFGLYFYKVKEKESYLFQGVLIIQN